MSRKPYPTAPQPTGQYPAQYPQAQYQTVYPYQQQYGQPMGGYGGLPPYGAAPQGPPPPYSEYPQQTVPAPQHGVPMAASYPYPQQQQQPQTVTVNGLFDSGARFDGVSRPVVPPPPPGVTPNHAQIAAMQGHQVIGTQQSSNWFSGNRNSGGETFW